MKLKPVGQKILVKPIEEQQTTTDSGIFVVNQTLAYGEVVEVSEEYGDIYSVGDTVIFPKGAGISEQYKGNICLWLNAKGAPDGDIWAKVLND
jgi:co-chaperonin GroES (HSP10)